MLAGSPWGLIIKSTGGIALKGVIGGAQEVVNSVVAMGLKRLYVFPTCGSLVLDVNALR